MLERVARLGAAVPGGHAFWGPGTVTAWLIGGGTFVLLRRMAAGRGTAPARRAVLVAAVGAVGTATLQLPAIRRGDLEIHVIDVGQGDAIAIRTPGGRWILVDTGPRTDRWDAGIARIAPYLRDHGARAIDVMILTHPDLDHIGGAPGLLRSFPVRALIDPALPAAKAGFFDTIEAARGAGVPWYAGRAGRDIVVDGVTLSMLAPEDSLLDGPADANDLSVVFRLTWRRFAALFTGDAPRSVENGIVATYDSTLAVDLLKVGHHGSRTSTGDSLLAAFRPSVAVVSVGARNRYGHPNPGVMARLARYGVRTLRTDEAGSIVVRVSNDGSMTFTSER
jgi:competence protein ComEC